jgi:trans-aconitate methyltransferase
MPSRTPDRYFEQMYADHPDPWGYETRWYEQRKYALTLAALPRSRYRRAFEPGCSLGVLTALLAQRCDAVVGLELLPEIADRARTRAGANASITAGRIPEAWPAGPFDLVVLSEVLYYLVEDDFAEVFARLAATLAPDGHVIAVHWRGPTDYPLSGDRVHELLEAHRDLRSLAAYREDAFRLSVHERST